MAFRVHKQKTAGFGNVKERRILRAVENNEKRRQRRSAIFTANRPVEEHITPSTSSVENQQVPPPDSKDTLKEDRLTKLKKWKAERELQKKLQKKSAQSVFQTGIYHHKLNSPVFLHQCKPVNKPTKPPSPRITKATLKRIAAKKNISEQDKVQTNEITVEKSTESFTKSKIINGRSVAEYHQSKSSDAKSTLELNLNNCETLNENKNQDNVLPVYFSPYVVSARGKRASRKEQQHNLEIGERTFIEKKSDEIDVQSKEDKSEHEEEITTSHFKIMVKKEVNRLKILCQHWTIVKTDDSISEDSQQLINQAIGQTNLFITKKVEQFKQLIADCEFGTGEKLVTCQDLQGFWDMMYMQVEDCDSRFNKLKKLQERNWKEEKLIRVKKAVVTAAKKPTPTKKIISKSSSIRDAIRAARKKQMEEQKTEHNQDTIIKESNGEASANYMRLPAVNFDGGFFVVQSPKKIITPRSIRKSSSLAQKPELLNTSERRRSALILMNVSQKLKPPEIKPVEIEWDPTIEYVNHQQTPGRSILKRIDTVESISCSKKSQNKVIFSKNHKNVMDKKISGINQQFNIMSDFEDNHEDDETLFDAKRQLNLSDLESDVEETGNQESTHINKNFMQKENLPQNSPEIPKQRRSNRKSVKIAGGDCPACSETVTPQPTTPRRRRRQSKLMETPNKSEVSTKNRKPQTPVQDTPDLISWDTPKEPLPILRRSLRLKNYKT